MQRILLSALVMAGVVGAAVYGTSAFFSDSETSTGNTFAAGSVDLTIDSLVVDYNGDQDNAPVISVDQNQNGFYFTVNDIKPLDDGTITYNLTNGSNEAYVCALVEDATPNPVANDTALAGMMNFLFGTESGTVSTVAGQWQSLGVMAPAEMDALSVDYCFGVYDGTNCVLDDIDYNPAQLGQMVVDLKFYAEQTRNNPNFTCDSLNEISNADLYVGDKANARLSDKWLFYNDENDTIMTINQFTPVGANEIVSGPVGVGAARMMLHEAAARYNVATFRFKDVKLSDISSIKYRIYDVSDATFTPFVNFNVDFANDDSWQRRLVQVPTGIAADTWSEVDALQGGAALWTLSGGNWPAGVNEDGSTPGSTPMTWATILTEYLNAETRSTDSFFGIRVGHPGPANEESYIDWVEFDGVKYDFNN